MRRYAIFILILHFFSYSFSASTVDHNFIYAAGELKANSLPLIGIRINGGAKFTNTKSIEVEVKSLRTDKSLIGSMRVGFEPDLSTAQWRPYSEEVLQLQLPGEDGEKVIYVQLQDKAGNSSPIESNKIIYDTTPPANSAIIINKGEKYSNDKLGRVLVNVKAEDAHELMVSNFSSFQNARWEPYKESVRWILDISGGNGEKAVYVKFKDQAGNESAPVSDDIIFDTTPPEGGTIVINDGAKYCRSRNLKLTVTASDATKLRIVSRGVGKNYDFTPDASGKMDIPWVTDSLQGPKSVKAYFMDEAKNTTKMPAEASIILNSTPPTGALISIEQGRKYTNNANGIVSVKLSAKENPQLLRMLISNKPNFEGAKEQPFTNTISNWQLDSEQDGLKTIYVRVIDQAGNVSDASKSEIFLDRTPPTVNAFNINGKNEWSISLKVTLNCDVDDAHEAQFSNNPNTLRNIKWERYTETRQEWTILPNDGEKVVYARFRDEASNVTKVVSAKIKLDMTPPNGKLIINEGAKVTNNAEGLVNLQIEHDEDVIGMQIVNTPDFNDVKLLPLESKIENWALDGAEDGPKTVFARLRDKAGNFSRIYTANIVLDRVPPKNCELVINNNDPYLRNKNKRVYLSLRGEGANEVMISNSESMEGAKWIPFKTALAWTLEGDEGIQYVYARFRDAAGNESEVFSKSIKLDFSPPKIVKFEINGGAEYTTDAQNKVSITFDVKDAVSMVLSNSHLNDSSSLSALWEPYQPSKDWQLEGEDGLKVVYARFKDEAGNVTHEIYEKIMLDKIAPTEGKVSINGGAEWLTSKEGIASINLFAHDAHEVTISNSTDFTSSTWEPMSELRKNWKLNADGPVGEVHVKYRDKAGNVSEPISASIKIDHEPPKNASITLDKGAKYVTNRDRSITIDISVEGATGMRISQNKTFRDVQWEPIATSKEIILEAADGEKVFYAQFSDDAGNLTDIVSSKIILDTTPPKLSKFMINEGEEWTNDTEKKVKLTIEAEGANEMIVGESPEFSNASWVPYEAQVSDFELPGEDGEKILFIKLKDEIGNESRVGTAKINLKRSF